MSDAAEWVKRLVAAVQPEIAHRARAPVSTYRLQMHPQHMTFRDAAQVVPYLHELGASHLYVSPCRKTRSGSPHGYAIVDYGELNPELGTAEDHQALVRALQDRGMGKILDIVPNHMSAAPGENPWWTDVLENGPGSPYAACFDIDWDPVKGELHNRLLLPLLGDQYGEVLESGLLKLEYADGAFVVRYYQTALPLDPKTYPQILTRHRERLQETLSPESPEFLELESILTALEHLPDRNQLGPEPIRERQREKEVIKKRLHRLTTSCWAVAEFVAANLAELNGTVGDVHSFDDLHGLLDAQVYRLAHWKTSGDEINYRRFFDVNELAAVCMEDPAVFEKGHRLVFDLLAQGDLSGVRIDHIDGLFDPTEYLRRLQRGYLRMLGQRAYTGLGGQAGQGVSPADTESPAAEIPPWETLEPAFFESLLRADDHGAWPLLVLVEKILGPEEPLPRQWPVAGTTGYDFLRSVNGVFVDWAGLRDLYDVFERFLGQHMDFREVVYESKASILRAAMSSELQLLARRLNRLSERHRRCRDFTHNMLRRVLREIIACFAVYRTYLRAQEVSDRDCHFVLRAVAQAKRRNPDIPAGAFDFVRDVLLFEQPADLDAAGCRDRELFVGRFQQVTSPVMAKGVEDTACYRFFPLSALNEVGDDPGGRAAGVEDFHRENLARHNDWPASLLCTTTHDTKRSEDVRARIDVLSEIPHEWRKAVNRWARLNRRHGREVDGSPAPSRSDEYLFYQSLVGVWPTEPIDAQTHHQLVARLQAYMEKATREAKVRTSWLNPHTEYDAAVREFVAAVLDDLPGNRFLAEFRAFQSRVLPFGLCNALGQTLLKLTSPGVPDIYQGQELWDFSLVDPDNRRPVDFALRRELLAELQSELSRGPAARLALARRLAANPLDSRLKLFVTWQALQFRRSHRDLFRLGCYMPIAATGPQANHLCAFAWQWQPEGVSAPRQVVVAAPRFISRLAQSRDVPPQPATLLSDKATWADTCLLLPMQTAARFTNLFTGQSLPVEASTIHVAELFRDFPVVLLAGGDDGVLD